MADGISVIIPTMNRENSLKRTIAFYLKALLIPDEIIIVDQSNNENIIQGIKRFLNTITGVRIIYYHQDIASSTMARNKGLSLANNDIIVFSDDDVDIYDDTLKNIVEIMQDKSVCMIGGLNDNGARSKSNIGYLIGTKSFKKRKIGHVTYSMLGRYPNNVKGTIATEWAMGYFFVVRKSLVEKHHISWDEKLVRYAYAEDLDFSYSYYKAIKKAGDGRCVLTDKVRVKHLGSLEYRNPSREKEFMYVLNRYYLSRKHKMGKRSLFWMALCNRCRLISAIYDKEKYKNLKDAIRYLKSHKEQIALGIFYYGN